jgi:hypothetical protein
MYYFEPIVIHGDIELSLFIAFALSDFHELEDLHLLVFRVLLKVVFHRSMVIIIQ